MQYFHGVVVGELSHISWLALFGAHPPYLEAFGTSVSHCE